MSDPSPDEPTHDDTSRGDLGSDSWLDRARAASVTMLKLVERNPHGGFPTGRQVEPWPVKPHPLHPTE